MDAPDAGRADAGASDALPDGAYDGGIATDGGTETGTPDAATDHDVPTAGGSCQTALPLEPGTHSIDTSLFGSLYDEYAGSCAGSPNRLAARGPEAFVSVTVPGAHRLEVRASAQSSNHAITLVLLDSCTRPQSDCVKAVVGAAGQPVNVESTNTRSEPHVVTLIIDGADPERDRGKVTLEIGVAAPVCGNGRLEPGEHCDDGRPSSAGDGCDALCNVEPGYVCNTNVEPSVCRLRLTGDSCADPFVVPGLPFFANSDLSSATDDYALSEGRCSPDDLGGGGPDHVYSFTPNFSGLHAIEVVNRDFSPDLYVVTDCGQIEASCIAGSPGPRLLVELTAGTTYYVVVDARSAAQSRAFRQYTLHIARGCAGCDGENCLSPFLVGALPFMASRDLMDATADQVASTCPGYPYRLGEYTGDHAYRFVPPSTAAYQIRLDATDAGFYVVEGCQFVGSRSAGPCVGSAMFGVGAKDLQVALEQGKAYSVVVEGNGDQLSPNPYTLQISEPCVPDCSGNSCGSDGCLGSCGACNRGETCRAGHCSSAGDTCTNSIVVGSVPFSDIADSRLFQDDLSVTSCPGASSELGAGTPEAVYRFTPEVTGNYTIEVNAEGGFDTALYVTTECANPTASCVRGIDTFATSHETLAVTLEAGRSYYVVVDGFGSPVGARFQIDISAPCVQSCTGKLCGSDGCGGSCGTCSVGFCVSGQCVSTLPGDSCDEPLVIPEVPFDETNDSAVFRNQYSHTTGVCPGNAQPTGAAANDVVYSFTPAVSGRYTIEIQEDGWDSALYVATDCSRINATCVAGADVTGGLGESISVSLLANTRYFIVVDGWSNEQGPYSIAVSAACIPDCTGRVCGSDGCGGSCGTCSEGVCSFGQCGAPPRGDTCGNAYSIASLPFADTNDTRNFNNHYAHLENSCPGNSQASGAASRDVVYTFTPATSGKYHIHVQETGWDSALYVTTDCANVSDSCVAGSDGGFSGDGETIDVRLEAGVPYFIVVDGWDNVGEASGPYTIDLAPIFP